MSNLENFALYTLCRSFPINLEFTGFNKVMRGFNLCFGEDAEGAKEWYKECRITPDAYFVDKDRKEVHIFEIEDSSKLDWNKITKLFNLHEALSDECGWILRIFVTDRYGLNLTEIPIDSYECAEAMGIIRRRKKTTSTAPIGASERPFN